MMILWGEHDYIETAKQKFAINIDQSSELSLYLIAEIQQLKKEKKWYVIFSSCTTKNILIAILLED